MIKLANSLRAWSTGNFEQVFKDELQAMNSSELPLQQAVSQGSHVAEDEGFRVMVINSHIDNGQLMVKAGVFYSSIIAGCACADDPTPEDTYPEYCELQLSVDTNTAKTEVRLLPA